MRARGRTAVLILATVALLAAAVFATAASAAPSGLLGLTSARWSPPANVGCDEGATIADGVITIPIEVFRYRDYVEPIIQMCFDGKGPYPMALDTGAADSVITTRLARRLGLKPVSSPFRVRGAGCTIEGRAYGLEGASVGGVELEGGDVAAIDAPWKGANGPMGSLGADILSRFGSVKIDYRRETLTLGAEEEGPWFKQVKDPPPVPGALVKSKPKLTVPMRVTASRRGVFQTVKVKVGSTKAQPWLVDTGSATSVIEPRVVRAAGLRATGVEPKARTYCSIVAAPEYQAPSLSLGAGKLTPQTVISFKGAALGNAGILSSYSLSRYGSVVFDWPGAEMLLGVG
jgi:Aspartyl protease